MKFFSAFSVSIVLASAVPVSAQTSGSAGFFLSAGIMGIDTADSVRTGEETLFLERELIRTLRLSAADGIPSEDSPFNAALDLSFGQRLLPYLAVEGGLVRKHIMNEGVIDFSPASITLVQPPDSAAPIRNLSEMAFRTSLRAAWVGVRVSRPIFGRAEIYGAVLAGRYTAETATLIPRAHLAVPYADTEELAPGFFPDRNGAALRFKAGVLENLMPLTYLGFEVHRSVYRDYGGETNVAVSLAFGI